MSDSGAQYWDVFYLTNFTLTAATQTVSLSSTMATFPSGDTFIFPQDQLSSDGGQGPVTLHSPDGGNLVPGDTLTDTDGDGTVTYVGQGVINIDGGGTATAIFCEATINGQNLVVAYVPNNDGSSPEFTSSSDLISKNPSVVIKETQFDLPCFIAGTLIRTPDGDRAVETLRQGDLVLTADGATKPVVWLGRSTHTSAFADQAGTLPVRIKAGALGENLPARDLLVSPGHAMLVDGVLVHAGAMVNGSSIERAGGLKGNFTYYHVETDGHDVLLAEGAPTESFLVGTQEVRFDNWADRPATVATPAELAFPRVKAARQLPGAVRELLASRAAVIAPDIAVAA